MNNERLQKARETRKTNSERFKTQEIQIDNDWKILRADELNWEIRYKGRFYGYFGSILTALQGLPAKMIGEETKNSIADLQRCHNAISERIETALKFKLLPI